MIKQEIEQIIIRHLSGEATGEDTVHLSEWLASDDANKASFLRYSAYWNAKVAISPEWDKAAAWDKLAARIAVPNRSAALGGWRVRLAYVSAAAVIALVVALSVFMWMNKNGAGAVEHYSFLSGKSVANVTLPDGTEVSLNRNSRLTYSSEYGKKSREVALNGEAYFRVVKDAANEFTVNMGENKIVVLGTSFDVNYIPEENILTATLIEGSIRFKTQDQEVILKPNQHLAYNNRERQLSISVVESEIISAWKDNLIKYKSIAFAEFTCMLEKQYGAEIIINDPDLKNSRVSGAFDASLTIEEILDIMKATLDYEYKKENNKYVITKEPLNP
ncbi:MAG: FecR domain-containing protein [Tannerellaceae bacterium]|jgi:ferric-dicitrate binding protein FerR (iron transport regulator)|nr:FecR domain-containing protein [Tannerellaceae bacterium]